MARRLLAPVPPCLVLACLALASAAAAQDREAQPFENLKVLAADIPLDSLQVVMSRFASALGVRCSHCHVQSRGERNFAADDKPTKDAARDMMRMTAQINATLRDARGEAATPVTCVTCHRGASVPRTLQADLRAALGQGGIDAATARYRELREEFFGRAVYDFGENSLVDLAGDLSRAGDDYAAIEFLRLNVEFFPESAFSRAQLAGALHRIGADDEARMRLEEALRIDPDDRFARRQMDRLFGGGDGR